jgi:diguanylate cyclase (GGDEF)-like protein
VIGLIYKNDLLKSLFIICIATGVIFLFAVQFIYHKQNPSTYSKTREFDGWYTMLNGKQILINGNAKVDSISNEYIVYNVLPKDIDNYALLFRTYHQSVEAIVDGQVIYEFGKSTDKLFCKSPGLAYHMVNLDNSYGGKLITIRCKSAYQSTNGNIFDYHIGPPEALIIEVISENLVSLLVNSLLFIYGVIFLLIASLYGRRLRSNQALYIGSFVLLFSVWSILQTCVFQLLLNHNVLLMFIEYLTLLLCPIAVVLYVRELFRMQEDKGIKLLVAIFAINFVACIALQLLGVVDIKQLLPIFHVLVIITNLYIFISIYKQYKNLNFVVSKNPTRIMCVIIFVVIVMDIIRYYIWAIGDSSKYTRIGVLILISYMLFNYAREYVNRSKEYTEARLMAKLAYEDVMTGLYNRTAYVEDTAGYEKELYLAPNNLNLIYIIFDLNNLKIMNDFHGHGVGDHYIVTTGKIIKKAFENIGKCYRIGGDEFAVIIKDKSLDDCQNSIKELKILISKENEIADLDYSLAYGYAVFEAGKYTSLKELIDRADKNMYENKNIYKETQMVSS